MILFEILIISWCNRWVKKSGENSWCRGFLLFLVCWGHIYLCKCVQMRKERKKVSLQRTVPDLWYRDVVQGNVGTALMFNCLFLSTVLWRIYKENLITLALNSLRTSGHLCVSLFPIKIRAPANWGGDRGRGGTRAHLPIKVTCR